MVLKPLNGSRSEIASANPVRKNLAEKMIKEMNALIKRTAAKGNSHLLEDAPEAFQALEACFNEHLEAVEWNHAPWNVFDTIMKKADICLNQFIAKKEIERNPRPPLGGIPGV